MRIDVVSIFPEYLAPLELSLIGKARQDGLLELNVHDLRAFTTDRHRTVDDTPYGGGAGMVMKAEPWAQALESVAAARPAGAAKPVLIVPSPAGERFNQALA
jgi:tRNA (guanine37-N1)-methyltransferase